MTSPAVEIQLSHSDDSFDFDTTPIPFNMDEGTSDGIGASILTGVDHQRATHRQGEDGWIHTDASSQQSWFGGSQSWYEQTTNSFAASCCQLLPDAFMPPRHSFTPPQSPSPSSQQEVRVARSPPPPPRKPSRPPASEWRSMRSSCYDASRRYYKNDYGSQTYNYSHGTFPEPSQSPPSHVPHMSHCHAPPPSRDQGIVHQSESMDTSECAQQYPPSSHTMYAQPYYPTHEEHAASSSEPQPYASTPQPRKYSREYREPAPAIPPIVSPTPTYPSPTDVKKASAEELYDGNSICDDPSVLRPNDIVCGRGAPSQFHRGNSVFRDIISDYQTVYLCARRSEKPRIANQVLDEVRKSGGRFVRRTKRGSKSKGAGVGAFAWEEIEDKKALEKVCQELRNGAPELQRQMLAASR